MLLEFVGALGLAVANTWFVKDDSRMVTYESGGVKTVVDYVLVRRNELCAVKDVKVIPSEECFPQHKLLVCVMKLRSCVKEKKKTFVSKRRVWKLKETEVRKAFEEKFNLTAVAEKVCADGHVDVLWQGLKKSLVDVTEEVCGRTKGGSRHKETWWWNSDVDKVVGEKRRAYLVWRRTGAARDKEFYLQAKRNARRLIAKAQDVKRQEFCENLITTAAKGKLFKAVKQMVRKNADVLGGKGIKDKEGRIVTEEEEVKGVWKEYFNALLNEEFQWNRDSLEHVDEVSGPCELISVGEVRCAIAEAKIGKAAGPSGVVVEMLKASGEAGVQWVTDICNAVVRDGKIPEDWRKSWMVSVYKGKGDALECGSYRGIKLLDQVMKVFERVIEKKVRERVKLDSMQFGFRPGRGTTDAIFIIRQIQEKYLAKGRDVWMAFVDLEKAFDRVPREVLWWALRSAGIEEWIVNVIKSLYCGASTSVKLQSCETDEFEVKVGVHQGSVLSPLLFTIVLNELSKHFREGLPWELLYADDLALIAETEEELLQKIRRWKAGMEEKGLRVNLAKTKVLRCCKKTGQVEESGKWPCGVCKKGVGSRNAILCRTCGKWIHKKCSGVRGRLRDVDFRCSKCSTAQGTRVPGAVAQRELSLRAGEALEIVDRFCYLGDMIGDGGGAEEASRVRVQCAWGKFRALAPILTTRGASLKIKGTIYRSCVQSVMIYGSETWATKVEDVNRLVRAERMMVRWMCGVTLKDRIHSEELLERLGITSVADVVRRGRLRWFGHVERMPDSDWVSKCRLLNVVGARSRGRGRKTWQECVNEDLKKVGLTEVAAQDRAGWRRGVLGGRLTRASTDIHQADVK
jgi:hypothetical protein